jgi:heterodisulfide reductase subunit B
MKVSYYPGCSLEGTANDYAASIEAVSRAVDLELKELEDWNCCGATAAHSINHHLALDLPMRNLLIAYQAGLEVVVPCALCFNRLKVAEKALKGIEAHRSWQASTHYVKIWDLLDYFTQEPLLKAVAEKITTPLTGLKAVPYYGCLVTRPPEITDRADYENPRNMELLLRVLGADPIDWSFKTDCCGAGLAVARPDIIDTLVHCLYERALAAGAECLVVSCQMCQANLDLPQERISQNFGKQYYLPVLYFTELIGLALGLPEAPGWLDKHLVDPRPLLREKGLL